MTSIQVSAFLDMNMSDEIVGINIIIIFTNITPFLTQDSSQRCRKLITDQENVEINKSNVHILVIYSSSYLMRKRLSLTRSEPMKLTRSG